MLRPRNHRYRPILDTCYHRSRLERASHSSQDSRNKNDFFNKHKLRYHEYNKFGKAILQDVDVSKSKSHFVFKIMDYNILSHTHMLTHIYNYKKCPRQTLNWNYRKTVLKDELLEENPDILCLQEVEGKNKSDLLEPFQNLGFDGLYVPRGADKPDGCAILFKTSLFRVAEFSPVEFLRPEVPLLDRPNVGMVLKLELRNHPGNFIVVANTHLLFNPRRVDIKLCQLIMLLAETERVAFNASEQPNRYHPVILTGDLNVKQDSSLISLLSSGFLDITESSPQQGWSQQPAGLSLPTELLQKALQISETCQYLDVVEARKNGLRDPRAVKDLQELLTQHRIYPQLSESMEAESLPQERLGCKGESQKEVSNENVKCSSQEASASPGFLQHLFSFVEVYNHPQIDKSEPKNKHQKKLDVYDYMFYSCDVKRLKKSNQGKLKQGDLQLLSRLRMPSQSEFYSQVKSLPNYACGSDHLPLVATFLLPLL